MSSYADQLSTRALTREADANAALKSNDNARVAVARFIRRKPLGAFGGFLVLLMLFTAIFADAIAPFPYDAGKGDDRLQTPSAAHIFGTDNQGRDMFSRIVYGSRVSVVIGFGAVFVGTGLATIIGLLSGYAGGKFDLFFQRVVDIWIAFPALVLLIAIITIFTTRNTDAPTSIAIVAVTLGLLVAANSSRVVRGAVLAVRNQAWMEAARGVGVTDARIIMRHVLPNVFPTILILATVQVKPPMPAWGSMLSGSGRQFFLIAPWLAIWPGLAISLAVFGFNMFGDALRDVLDPRLRGTR
ncbi:MAG: ABC transporter permease [Chloroflexi bacterium]|nr:ABC transporter permease [Chloroflexota bacterium]